MLADGILDACQLRRVEDKFREWDMQSAAWIARQKKTIERALGNLDVSLPRDDWRTAHPALAAWYADFAQRPSMAGTASGG